MKKNFLTPAVAVVLLLTTSAVFASPVEFSGSATIENRQEDNNNVNDSGTKYTLKLNAKTNIDKNLDFYARFAAQGLSNASVGKDFNKAGNFVGEVDQYGLLYKNAGFTYKLGRQDLFLASGLLADYSANVGRNYLLDGITVSGKSGATSLNFVALQEDNIGNNDNKIYAINASFSPSKDWTLGGTFAKYDAPNSTNYWAIDTSYSTGKATIYGDYAQSDTSTANKAYSLGVSYAMDSKNSIYVANFKVEDNASINGWTTWWSGQKGYWYNFSHKLNKDTTVSLSYKDNILLSNNTKKTSFRSTVNYKF